MFTLIEFSIKREKKVENLRHPKVVGSTYFANIDMQRSKYVEILLENIEGKFHSNWTMQHSK